MDSTQIDTIREFDRLIRRDPGKRGLISSESEFGPLCRDHLLNSANHLFQNASQVVISTGFYVPSAVIPSAETDGPPGAILLASLLEECGINTSVVTDELCAPVVAATMEAFSYPASKMNVLSTENEEWIESFFHQQTISHLISVERVGPSHTIDSFTQQPGQAETAYADFQSKVTPAHFDRCHNMRGEIIDQYTAPLHLLFERLSEFFPEAKTIGVGDGGNEIGMGIIPWEELDRRIASDSSGLIPCRIATDWNIVAGTSNWGASALAAAVALLKGQSDALFQWQRAEQQQVLESIVNEANAVDGVTKQREPTVDGLPFLTYMQPWEGILKFLAR
ncbi:glutamate cyclase domain-containing protein [Gimesia aquarii]|uniref:D-glutamate cyclase-like C-terminal domain-containing protein n=1 Tax=Gimesia aquarii TaxID=2527964 RepID=A0A517W2B2_9PLAN|nr:glutamate cyclase domain-containing protein [Gimesia aquarii]QDT99405.1 hypothetical protein V144x_49160 [Gimesia aquarii]